MTELAEPRQRPLPLLEYRSATGHLSTGFLVAMS